MIIIRDITREKRLVEEIKESEARLKLLMSQLPAIIWTTDVSISGLPRRWVAPPPAGWELLRVS